MSITEFCPVCQKGGTTEQRLKKANDRILELEKLLSATIDKRKDD